MTVRLTHALATTGPLAEVFSDRSVLQGLLDVESGLARAQADAGVIPPEAATLIARAADVDGFDAAALAEAARRSASIAIPLVDALTARVAALDETAARYVHWGATSQDILDTAMSRLIARAVAAMAPVHVRLSATLRDLSARHRDTLMLGRTLLQPAVPITFGLEAAGWCAAERRGWTRLEQAGAAASVLQFGGAGGTLASLGDRGPAVSQTLARHLGLLEPAAPWHTHRDRIAALVAACGLYCGALGKIARDVSLLMQHEVGEVAEAGGGSSAMPQKRNPSGCAIVLAAAVRLPGLAAASLTALVQEHERAVGGWQAEWPTVVDALETTASAADAMLRVVDGLTVDATRMRANLDATRGAVLAERLTMLLVATLGRERARVLAREAIGRVDGGTPSLSDAARSIPDIRAAISDDDLAALDDPSSYLGQAEAIRRRLLDTE